MDLKLKSNNGHQLVVHADYAKHTNVTSVLFNL